MSDSLANKPKQNYSLFAELSLALVLAYDANKKPHIILARENQHIQEISRHSYGTLNHFVPMVFASNLENLILYF